MKDYEKFVQQIIKDKVHELQVLSDFIWNHHEILYKEYDSSTEICKYLEAQGFESDRGIANISAAFTAIFGHGGAVIGIFTEYDALLLFESFGVLKDQHLVEGKYLSDVIQPYESTTKLMYASTDVAAVGWNVLTAQVTTAAAAIGTQLHTWQMVAQVKSSMAHKGMLRVARVLARSAIYVLQHPEKLKEIEQEFNSEIGHNQYESPLLAEVNPPIQDRE